MTLKGDSTLTTEEVTLKTLTHTCKDDDCGFLIKFQYLKPEEVESYRKERTELEEVPILIQGVLDEFKDIFAKPTSLPPKRVVDHRTVMKADAAPVNVRPYKYNHM